MPGPGIAILARLTRDSRVSVAGFAYALGAGEDARTDMLGPCFGKYGKPQNLSILLLV